MIYKKFHKVIQCFLILFTFFLSQNISNAQQQLPACVDFEEIEPGTSGNWVGNNVDDFGVVQNANSGNQFLTASDASGGSGVQGPAPLAGNWNKLLEQGLCLELCWDVKLLNDGHPGTIASGPTSITIISGSGKRATFTTSSHITDTNPVGDPTDWYTFCAPVKELDANGDLPENAQGFWSLSPGEPNSTWTDILSDVKQVYFQVDFLGSPDISEAWNWDNICLRESEDCDCMKVSELQLVSCKQQDDGTWIFIYNFDITNLSGFPTDRVLLDGPATFIPSGAQTMNLVLADGQTTPNPLTVAVTGNPGDQICFDVILFTPSQNGGPSIVCCQDEICVNLPCLKIVRKEIECIPGPQGTSTYDITMTLLNISNSTVSDIYFLDETGGNVSFNPDHIDNLSVLPGGVMTVTTNATVSGGVNPIVFRVTIHDEDFEFCCDLICELELPDCDECECIKELEFNQLTSDQLDEMATLVNLNLVDGKLELPPAGTIKTLPYIWMAASSRSTIVRINTNTGTVIGEYKTQPGSAWQSGDPSRTTVDQFGECWVGNRNDIFDGLTDLSGNDLKGSVIRVGFVDGGTRHIKDVAGNFVPNPNGEYIIGGTPSPSVVDRDGDGAIRTSTGLGNTLQWDFANSGINDAGGVSAANDECITNFVRTQSSKNRALALDSNNDLWVGGTGNNIYQHIDGQTGTRLAAHSIPGGYGALIDGNDVLWSVRNGIGVQWVDLSDPDNLQTSISAGGAYGIGIDPCNNEIFVGSSITGGLLREYDAAGTLIGQYTQPAGAQGLSVDDNGTVWLAKFFGDELIRMDPVPPNIPNSSLIPLPVPSISEITGTAVDSAGKIWMSGHTSNSAGQYNPITGNFTATNMGNNTHPSGVAAQPYNYSDMTGRSSLSAGGQNGYLTVIHDSLCEDTVWGRVSWLAEVTGAADSGCGVTAEVRASNNINNFPANWQPVNSGQNICNLGIIGQYIQVRVNLNRPAGCPPECDIRLCSLTIECCEKAGNKPPMIEAIKPLIIHPAGDTEPILLRTIIEDKDNDPLVYQWVVNDKIISVGESSGRSSASLSYQFKNGINEVSIKVTDGKDETVESTIVEIGDHTPPVIITPFLESLTGFSSTVPDVISDIKVSDNIGDSINDPENANTITITQEPKAGTPISQGTTAIRITATDAAGNSSSTTTHADLKPIVKITDPVKYAQFEAGDIISVEADAGAFAAQISRWEILVNGNVLNQRDGNSLSSVIESLPEGMHQLAVKAYDFSNHSSLSKAIKIIVIPKSDTEEIQPRLRLGKINKNEQNFPLNFLAPVGFQCCVQFSEDLINWEILHQLEGTDENIEIAVEVIPGTSKGFYRLLLIEGQDDAK
ncbi:hypothetical protein N9274_01280 [Akkermansiaceae bacterium]|nr:hypothetical protein [Akkermansiaceae bacterium]MDB4407493.1 hypothetical protein [bacterium]MDB4425093.1 hypothetical protein [Akkermansiaceae bacterium]